MPSFLKDYSDFYGTGEKNEDGRDLDQFLEDYNPGDYERPSVTADILVFKSEGKIAEVEKGLSLLMIRRKNHPCIGYWALPGGFVEIREDIRAAAKRELFEETNLKNIPMEQLYTWGEALRDPRGRIVTTAFLALLESTEQDIKAGDDAAEAIWLEVTFGLEKEQVIVLEGRERLQSYYKLSLSGMGSGEDLHLSAVVLKTETNEGLINETSYEVLSSEGIAFDHARFIVQALLQLDSKL